MRCALLVLHLLGESIIGHSGLLKLLLLVLCPLSWTSKAVC